MVNTAIYAPKDKNYISFYPSKRKERKTADATNTALEALRDFKRWSLIKPDDYERIKAQIKLAKSDSEVSVIMSKVRRRYL